jgi:GNAT superfamily N-acetyltransferase
LELAPQRLDGHDVNVVDLAPAAAGDPGVRAFLHERGYGMVARGYELIDPLACSSIVAQDAGRLVGVLSYLVIGNECEILTLHASQQWSGIGTALVVAMQECATRQGCTALRVTTTNDNVDALRFYQRRGFVLSELRRGAVDEARRTGKPTIPLTGDHGIPLRDEIELRRELRTTAVGGFGTATD